MPELIGSQIESVNRFIQCEQQNGVQCLLGQCLDRVLTGSLVFSLQRINVCVCVTSCAPERLLLLIHRHQNSYPPHPHPHRGLIVRVWLVTWRLQVRSSIRAQTPNRVCVCVLNAEYGLPPHVTFTSTLPVCLSHLILYWQRCSSGNTKPDTWWSV